MSNQLNKDHISRRHFFKYAAVSGIGIGSLTYSKKSEAFAWIAVAIETGETIGNAAAPFIQLSKEYMKALYELFITNLSNIETQSYSMSGDSVTRAIEQVNNAKITRDTAPVPILCNRQAYNSENFEKEEYKKSLVSSFNNQDELNYKNLIDSNVDIDMTSGMAYSWNSFGDANLDDLTSKSNLAQFYMHMGYTNDSSKEFNENQLEWDSFIGPILRKKLTRAMLNEHLSKQLTNYYRDIAERVAATYQSEEWRTTINGLASPVPLSKELVMQKTTENQVMYETLLSKHRLLTMDCINAINKIREGY